MEEKDTLKNYSAHKKEENNDLEDSIIFYRSEIYQHNSRKLIKLGFGLEKINHAMSMYERNYKDITLERIIDDIINIKNENSLEKNSENIIEFIREKQNHSFNVFHNNPLNIESINLNYSHRDFHVNLNIRYDKKETLLKFKTIKCEVCEEDQSLSDNIEFECRHFFCKHCVQEFYSLCVLEGNLQQLKCLNKDCNYIPSDCIFKSILSEKELAKLSYLRKMNEIINDKKKFFCPFPDCESFGVVNDLQESEFNSNTAYDTMKKEPIDIDKIRVEESISQQEENVKKNQILQIKSKYLLTCEKGHRFCSKCNQLWHEDKICDILQDKDFMNWLQSQNKDYKNCPRCGIWTEKMLGCNHIKCSGCKFEWCWICNGAYTPTHYSDEASKCRGRMYEGQNINFLNNDINLLLDDFNLRERVNDGQIIFRRLDQLELLVTYRTLSFGIFKFTIRYYRNCIIRLLSSILLYVTFSILNFPNYIIGLNSLRKWEIYDHRLRLFFMNFMYRISIFFTLFFYSIYTYFSGLLITNILYLPSLIRYIFAGSQFE